MSCLTCVCGGAVTMTFAIDLKDEGITVICYCPGWCAVCLLLPRCLVHVHGMIGHVLRPRREGSVSAKLMVQVKEVFVSAAVLLSA